MRYSQVPLFLAWASLAVPALSQAPQAPTLSLTHGVATGDITSTSAIVWARSSAPSNMTVEVAPDATFSSPQRFKAKSTRERDFTAQVTATGLEPATNYHYRVSFSGPAKGGPAGNSEAETGTFSTAPLATETASVHFVVAGDLGGQAYCRHAARGYDIFTAMGALTPDFFVANGDMIYADGACPAQGPGGWPNLPGDFPSIDHPSVDWTNEAQIREVYLGHWRYNRADPHHQAFLRRVPMSSLDAGNVGNVVFVVTDVHFAMNLRYHVDVDGDGDKLLFHEFVSGPLNAVRLPIPPQLDPTFKPTILYAEAEIFNFSYIKVERRGDTSLLVADVRDETGEVRFGSRVELVAE